MAFQQFKFDQVTFQSRDIFNTYIYETDDTIADVLTTGYFDACRFAQSEDWVGSIIQCKCSDTYAEVYALADGATELVMPAAADVAGTINLLHTTSPSLSATATLYKTVAAQSYTLTTSETITLVDGDRVSIDITTLAGTVGNEVLNIHAAKTLINTASAITEGAVNVTLAAGAAVVGQYVSVEGTIAHANYTPDRQLDAKVCGKVVAVSGATFTLDRTIDFSLSSVSVYSIPDIEVTLKATIDSCSIDLQNIAKVTLDCDVIGEVSDDGVFIDVNTSSVVNGSIRANNANCLIVAALNYVSGGNVFISQQSCCGPNVGSKVVRGNAVSHSTYTYVGNSANYKDFGFDGARNCVLNVASKRGGKAFFTTGSTAANRLEQVVIAESNNITINADITEANDQGLEIISGTGIVINGKIHNAVSTTSTEGAVIIKGATDGVTINADIKGYSSRGLKIECSVNAKNVRVLPSSKVFSSNNSGVAVRDGVSGYNANIIMEGWYSGTTPIDIQQFSNNCTVNAKIDMTLATSAGMVIQAPANLLSADVINSATNKQIASIGNTCTSYRFGTINADTDDAYITLNGDSRALFNFDRVKNVSAKLVMGGNSTVFFFRNGVPYTDVVPTLGAYSAGDFYQRKSSNKPTGSTMELGRKYDGTSWIQLLCSF